MTAISAARSLRSRSAGRLQRQAVEAVVQVFAEAPGVHLVAQPAVRGADQRKSTATGLPAAQRHHLPLLQHAQQPRLHRQRHVADLVEEQRAAVGLADAARRAVAAGAGEGAGPVAEQLGFDQRSRAAPRS
jgi:hypothetical protein